MSAPASERGFTLIELLTVIAIIGILASLALAGFSLYRANAAYSVCEYTLRNVKVDVAASIVKTDNAPGSVALVSQNTQGILTDPTARAFLPTTSVPRNASIAVSYDSGCIMGACQSALVEVRHCSGKEYTRYIRFGDGLDVTLEHIAGAGC